LSDINQKKSEGESTDATQKENKTTSNAKKEATTASKPKKTENKTSSSGTKKKSAPKKEQQAKADVNEKKQAEPAKKQTKKESQETASQDKAPAKKQTQSKAKKDATKAEKPKKPKQEEPKEDAQPKAEKDVADTTDEVEVAEKAFVERDEELISQELKELENIKNLVQEEVNKILENPETGDWNELVKTARQEIKEAKEAENIDEDDLCEVCGERARDTSISQSNPYCSECRELMKKHPFKFSEIFTPIIVVAILFLSSWQLSQEWGTFSNVAKAEALVKDKKLYSAVTAYDEINTQLKVNQKVIGKKILENQVELYNKLGAEYYENTEKFISKYYSGQNLDSFSNRKVKDAMTTMEEFDKVYEVVATSFQSVKDYKSFVKSFDETIKKDKDETYDKGLIEYWKYYAALAFEENKEVQLEHLKKMEKASPQYSSLYLPSLAELYLNMKDYDNMFKYCNALDSINYENLNTKAYRAIAYRLQGNFAKATKSVKDGLEIKSTDGNLNHQMAIILLIEGKPKEALQYAKTAYDNSTEQYMYTSNANLYALCAHLCNDSDTYTKMEETLGNQLSNDVISIIEGSKTLEDVFQKGEGDITWK